MDYKDKLRLAKEALDSGSYDKKTIEYIFPELKESKSERIKKVIYGWICTQPSQFFDNGFSKEEMLAWLEKQGEQLVSTDMKSINEKAKEYVLGFHPSIQRICKESFEDGANYVISCIEKIKTKQPI